jgi:acetyl-CoA synthetase/medium-chain acyl-CoA synthetase
VGQIVGLLSLPLMYRPNSGWGAVPAQFNFAADVLDRWAQERPDACALWQVNASTGLGQKFSFREIARLSCRAASFFQQSGLRPGDRVLVMLPRVPDWWIAMLGLIRLGAVPVPATLLLTPRDVAFRLETAQIRAVITNEDGVPKTAGFAGISILAGGSQSGWLDMDTGMRRAADSFSGPATRASDPGMIFFTSATTGDPKMVLHSQASYGLGHRATGSLWLDLGPQDLHWNISDLGWGKAAWSSFFGPWQMGACVFALDTSGRFDPVLALRTLEEFPITTWCAPPTALRLVVRQDLAKCQFAALRHCVTAGEPLNPEVFNVWRGATGLTLHEAYGQTETVVLVGYYRSLGHVVRPGWMGWATPGFELAVLDDDQEPVPPDEEGEIAIRVRPHRPLGFFTEYWQNPAEMARKFKGDWYLTGDRAVRDSSGCFRFVGRKDDVIKSSGYRIGPFEVESALIEHQAVLEAAVVGKPDALRGQIVKAYVILRPGIARSDELRTELQQHCKNLVAAYKYPREIEFIEELPKTTSGKTRHFLLRQGASV